MICIVCFPFNRQTKLFVHPFIFQTQLEFHPGLKPVVLYKQKHIPPGLYASVHVLLMSLLFCIQSVAKLPIEPEFIETSSVPKMPNLLGTNVTPYNSTKNRPATEIQSIFSYHKCSYKPPIRSWTFCKQEIKYCFAKFKEFTNEFMTPPTHACGNVSKQITLSTGSSINRIVTYI